MRILGIDPGLNITGYGLIEAHNRKFKLIEAGVIRTSPKDGIEGRLFKIYSNLADLADEYKPAVLVLEKLYAHYKHPTTALLMGHARGIACLVCGQKDVKLVSYPSTRIKKAVVGKGHASKRQIDGVITNLLGLKSSPKYNDVTDALAGAISYAYIEGI
ncbi:MAG: crossover junction endodeoxyribonuclease RuvC [Candidatus Omnitrophota bacterium]